MLQTGERRVIECIQQHLSNPIEDMGVESCGIWHDLPSLPAGRYGSWTFLAQPKQPSPSSTRANGVNGGAAAIGVSEPVAVQCIVRPMADDAGGVGDLGLSISLRSVAIMHNTTASALSVQLLVPSSASTDDGPPQTDALPVLTHGTPSVLDIGAEWTLDLGTVPAGGFPSIPPQYTKCRLPTCTPASETNSNSGFQWPDASTAFWLKLRTRHDGTHDTSHVCRRHSTCQLQSSFRPHGHARLLEVKEVEDLIV